MVAQLLTVVEPVEQATPAAEEFESNAEILQRLTGLDTRDREAMITHHLPLVRFVVGSMMRSANAATHLDYDDLVGYGTEGLIDAVDSFDPAYNVRFSTWAVMHIRTTIQDALRHLDPLPRSLRALQKAVERVQSALAQTHGAWPADRQVAHELGISVHRLHTLQQDINRTVVSLDHEFEANGQDTGLNWLSRLSESDPASDPQHHFETIEMGLILRQALKTLPEREQTVVRLHYGQNQSMRAISDQLGISPSRVSQLHTRTLQRLRTEMARLLDGAC